MNDLTTILIALAASAFGIYIVSINLKARRERKRSGLANHLIKMLPKKRRSSGGAFFGYDDGSGFGDGGGGDCGGD